MKEENICNIAFFTFVHFGFDQLLLFKIEVEIEAEGALRWGQGKLLNIKPLSDSFWRGARITVRRLHLDRVIPAARKVFFQFTGLRNLFQAEFTNDTEFIRNFSGGLP
ncbi:hypothetical protein [Cohnella rhizosphaerae]|uniref:Uncharacterized protein n=1 Tax=Cohnella rhizosphaerae TaxID=1457232 RepID=A0A9X4L0E6_9BACL|nr:hypothetical protein [Cohnella rhizosphaerae]MDG0814277.1 hypothetical protein [Cohnella rhizosphaerae]